MKKKLIKTCATIMLNLIIVSLVVLAITYSARADTWESENDAGGRIVLTESPCIVNGKTYPGALAFYTYTPGGLADDGCYFIIDKRVHAIYKDGKRYVYDPALFHKMRMY